MSDLGVLTLAIETSNPSAAEPSRAEVAVGPLGGAAVAVEAVSGDRDRDDLLPAMDRVCRTAGVRPAEVRVVAVSLGPGGFTSLRAACAAAKALAVMQGAGVVGVPSAVAAAAAEDEWWPAGGLAVALASKGARALVTVFEHLPLRDGAGAGRAAEGMRAMAGDEVVASGVRTLVADQHLPEAMRAACEAAGMEVRPLRLGGAAVLRAAGLFAVLHGEAADGLAPLYGREPEAVTLWRERRSGSGRG